MKSAVTTAATGPGQSNRVYRPEMTDAGLRPAYEVEAVDEFGQRRPGFIAGERSLTLFLDDREIVTLMTLGTHPEMLTLGYLLNQRLVPTSNRWTRSGWTGNRARYWSTPSNASPIWKTSSSTAR